MGCCACRNQNCRSAIQPDCQRKAGIQRNAASGVSHWRRAFFLTYRLKPLASKRGYRTARASNHAEAARLEVVNQAWRLRSQVLNALSDYAAINTRLTLFEKRVELQQQIVGMLEQRLTAGALPPVGDTALGKGFACPTASDGTASATATDAWTSTTAWSIDPPTVSFFYCWKPSRGDRFAQRVGKHARALTDQNQGLPLHLSRLAPAWIQVKGASSPLQTACSGFRIGALAETHCNALKSSRLSSTGKIVLYWGHQVLIRSKP